MAIFTETEAKLNLSEIHEIEQFVGIKFPDQYKEHLLQHNGGQCSPNVFKFNENGIWTESCIDWFLAIYNGEYDSLKNYIQTYKIEQKRMQSHLLPIAHDPGGNLICISCGGEDNGFIYFWDHENEINYVDLDDKEYSNLYLIAKTFNEFINGLKVEAG